MIITDARDFLTPHVPAYKHPLGLSGGQSVATYDIANGGDDITIWPIHEHYDILDNKLVPNPDKPRAVLGYSLEQLHLPSDVGAMFAMKSTHARGFMMQGVTWIDPGFEGQLVVELVCDGDDQIHIPKGSPMGQIIFWQTDGKTPYDGRYQGQSGMQGAILK